MQKEVSGKRGEEMAKTRVKKTPEEKENAKKEFREAGEKITPHPTPPEEKLKHIGVKEKIKRQRRTNEEIQKDLEAERIRDDGFETIAIFFKSLSDNDAAQYKLDKQPKEFFYPIAKNYAKILNYFLPKAKEIYFVITMTAFQSWTMLKARSDLINAKVGKKNEPRKESPAGAGKAGVGQEFPSQTTPQKV